MTQATELKRAVFTINTRDQALNFCRSYPWIRSEDCTESDTNTTNIFILEDDSELRIDTENFVYTNLENELEKVNKWSA